MKIVSPQILHKTEAGGVVVGVKSAEAAQDAFATIVDNARRYECQGEHRRRAGTTDAGGRPGGDRRRGDRSGPSENSWPFGLGGILVES